MRLRGRQDARHRRGDQRGDRGERGLRLSRRADHAARRRRNRRSLTVPCWRRRPCRRSTTFSRPRAGWRPGGSDMAVEIILPRVDMDMEAGKITRWFVGRGRDASPRASRCSRSRPTRRRWRSRRRPTGVLRGVTASAGETLPVGAVVGWIYAAGGSLRRGRRLRAAARRSRVAAAGGLRATPAARRIARERGRGYSADRGLRPAGRVQARDVEAAAAPALATPVALGRLNREWLARGAGAPIVFVHGFGADLNSWRRCSAISPRDAARWRSICPATAAPPLTETPTLEALVAALAAALGRGRRSASPISSPIRSAGRSSPTSPRADPRSPVR